MNIITVDLEEWYTYIVYKKGLPTRYEPILEKLLDDILHVFELNNIKATFFCLGIIARSHPNIIKKIFDKGHEIGCHSDKHDFLTKFNPKQLKLDTQKAIDSLEQCIGSKVFMYRAPAFTITQSNKWALETLIESGITIDCSIFTANRSYGGFHGLNINEPAYLNTPSGVITEFPMNYSTFFGKKIIYTGGGYFRLLPYNIIKNLFSKSEYNMTYFHLRDFDIFQKPVYNHRYFFNYVGISKSFGKLERLIDDFKFISVGEINDNFDKDYKIFYI